MSLPPSKIKKINPAVLAFSTPLLAQVKNAEESADGAVLIMDFSVSL